ncbi:hypothetical protein P7D43_05295 [Enterococcus avium]|uniref:PrgI family protein n=1 Tax=Enterococcus avium TaxID=33945 RepID=A0AAW8RU14_ENTAV|nr:MULTISPECIES: hypothetical protein [Enterococcus]MDT2401781.1 hypothetical protein [Enterococcus avium]MDT2434223.1 hypothetical protein [Enterococcus avium]MDT2466121.1 hypothetical protein [Enterococcus avium]MDT2484068.1 hypothetical protein [Enterococcus avium]MDT2505547.1 hypothetical protein [Enterococcus avium]
MAIQSKFYKDLSKFEPINRLGLTKRQTKMLLSTIPGVVIIFVLILFLDMNGAAFWILSFVTGSIFIIPPLLKGFGKWEEVSNRIEFFMKKQDRQYEAGRIRRYEANEFTQKKNVSETDKISKK